SEHELSFYEPYDVLYVRDKFPSVDEAIATRLGKLITRRRQLLAYRKGHQDKIQKNINKTHISQATTMKIATAVQSATKSVAEQTASEPTIRAESQKTRITNLTKATTTMEFFECNYCRLLPNITSDLAWRRHVLSDLQPYVCTFLECELSSHFFADRDAWYAHEKQHHR
ncbi:hypothetical protein DM02DRAFT_470415, partial [Periconia macrospinosa]